MNIILLGYMGSGKSLIGYELSKILNKSFIDFDKFIELKEKKPIREIFEINGEIYFRKIESKYLNELLGSATNAIIALGGGTPCYGNNMQMIKNNQNSKSVYLQASVVVLSKRLLSEPGNRPLLKNIILEPEMNEFVGKHLFERSNYYNQADLIIKADSNPEEIIEQIILKLF